MIYTERIRKAMKLAFDGHRWLKDKGGYPYFAHPLHLAEQCSTESEVIVALLHDIFEDTPTSEIEIELIATKEEYEAIKSITHNHWESYEEYIEKVSVCPLARKIKILDLQHNLDESRLQEKMPESQKQKYTKALLKLTELELSDQTAEQNTEKEKEEKAMKTKHKWLYQVVIVDTEKKYNDMKDYVSRKSNGQYLVIDNDNYSDNKLKELVENNVNRYVYIILKQGDYATYYSYEITYQSVIDKVRGIGVYDEGYTIQYHFEKLKEYIANDIVKFRNYVDKS